MMKSYPSYRRNKRIPLLTLMMFFAVSTMTSCVNPFEHMSSRQPGYDGSMSSAHPESFEPDSKDTGTDEWEEGSVVYGSESSSSEADNLKSYEMCGVSYQLDLTTMTASVQGTYSADTSSFIEIPEYVYTSDGMFRVEEISPSAFIYNQNLKEVTISGVSTIGEQAFYGCYSLVSLSIDSDNLIDIGKEAFGQCTSLTRVYLNSTNSFNISGNAFENCYRLALIQNYTPLELSVGGVDYGGIAYYAKTVHYESDGFFLVDDPDSYYAYQLYSEGRNYLLGLYSSECQMVSIPSEWNINVISSSAFRDKDVTAFDNLGDTMTEIGSFAFCNCNSLSYVNFGNALTTIGEFSFAYCTQLNNVTLPSSLTSIGWASFLNCNFLTEISYQGTMEEWNAVDKESDWQGSITTIHCSDGDISF